MVPTNYVENAPGSSPLEIFIYNPEGQNANVSMGERQPEGGNIVIFTLGRGDNVSNRSSNAKRMAEEISRVLDNSRVFGKDGAPVNFLSEENLINSIREVQREISKNESNKKKDEIDADYLLVFLIKDEDSNYRLYCMESGNSLVAVIIRKGADSVEQINITNEEIPLSKKKNNSLPPIFEGVLKPGDFLLLLTENMKKSLADRFPYEEVRNGTCESIAKEISERAKNADKSDNPFRSYPVVVIMAPEL